jgi:hypothetical protein
MEIHPNRERVVSAYAAAFVADAGNQMNGHWRSLCDMVLNADESGELTSADVHILIQSTLARLRGSPSATARWRPSEQEVASAIVEALRSLPREYIVTFGIPGFGAESQFEYPVAKHIRFCTEERRDDEESQNRYEWVGRYHAAFRVNMDGFIAAGYETSAMTRAFGIAKQCIFLLRSLGAFRRDRQGAAPKVSIWRDGVQSVYKPKSPTAEELGRLSLDFYAGPKDRESGQPVSVQRAFDGMRL